MKTNRSTRAKIGLTALCCVAALALSALVLAACTNAGTSASEESIATVEAGSLLAIHTNGQLNSGDYTARECLGCHDRTDLEEATDGYGGEVSVNPHAAHEPAGTCTDCHSVSGVSVIKCNSCHAWEVPKSWSEPEIAPARQTDLGLSE